MKDLSQELKYIIDTSFNSSYEATEIIEIAFRELAIVLEKESLCSFGAFGDGICYASEIINNYADELKEFKQNILL